MNTTNVDILICGAGAAGLTLAMELARRGVDFRLIEQRAEPFHGSRGKGIQPRTLEIFEDLGMVDRVHALGGPYPPLREHRADGSQVDMALAQDAGATPAEPYAKPWMLPQFITESIMRERLAELGHAVRFGHDLVGLQHDAAGVIAQVQGPEGEETVHARYLIGTDGGRSFVRKTLGIGFPGKTLDVRGFVADVMMDGLNREAWHRFSATAMPMQIGFCPLAGTDMFQIQGAVPLEGDIDVSLAGIQRLVDERTARTDIRIREVIWASAYRMHARLADRYRVGRVFLAGDAAHTHPPTGGQGLNTSVQDAYNLGWKLAAVLGGAPAILLDSYEDERRPIAADMLGLSTRLLDAARQGDGRRGREVRQLDLGYESSALAVEVPPRASAPRAGARAPDAPLTHAGGLPGRLFELFKGPHWTLLGKDVDRGAITPHRHMRVHVFGAGGDIVDIHGHIQTAYALEAGSWVLVRPDGYIGGFFAANQLSALHAYLQRVGITVPVVDAASNRHWQPAVAN